MSVVLTQFSCAVLPVEMLSRLGHLRAWPGLRALLLGDRLWLFWPAGEEELALALLAIDGAVLFAQRDGRWYRAGEHLPVFEVPSDEEARPLSSVLLPAAVEPRDPGPAGWSAVPLRLVPCDEQRPCVLLRTSLTELAKWAEQATSHQLESVTAAHDAGVVLLRGKRLPALPGERFWGRRVLFPVGRRPEPNLREDALTAALRLEGDDLALVTDTGVEVVPVPSFAPLSRAGVRLAASE